jgi:hypothetical protein
MDNNNIVDNNGRSNKVWVRLYQAVPQDDVPDAATSGGGTRTITSLRAVEGDMFGIRPVPSTIFDLRKAVKVASAPFLNHVAPSQLEVYKSMSCATDVLTLSSKPKALLPGDKVPFLASLEPMVVAVQVPVPAIYHVGSPALRCARLSALDLANQFAKSILSDLEYIPDSNGMQVMRDVMDLETGIKGDVILRRMANDFWDECMKFLDDPRYQPRLCVVGTPVIGKTAWTAFPIRMLLKQGKTVVYHIRGSDSSGWYYEFVPGRDTFVGVNVYPAIVGIRKIASLNRCSSFYMVEPRDTKDNCIREVLAPKSIVIVASPVGSRCGESELTKNRDKTRTAFRSFPVLDLEEVLLARTYMFTDARAHLRAEDVEARIGQVGGVPQNIFLGHISEMLQEQDVAMSKLTEDQVIDIILERMDAEGTFAENQPRSTIIGYETNAADPTFSFWKIDMISPLIAKRVFAKFIRDLLGGYNEIRLLPPDVVRAANEDHMVLFHSNDPNHPLYDFMCS